VFDIETIRTHQLKSFLPNVLTASSSSASSNGVHIFRFDCGIESLHCINFGERSIYLRGLRRRSGKHVEALFAVLLLIVWIHTLTSGSLFETLIG
jgi:hypothetical protein